MGGRGREQLGAGGPVASVAAAERMQAGEWRGGHLAKRDASGRRRPLEEESIRAKALEKGWNYGGGQGDADYEEEKVMTDAQLHKVKRQFVQSKIRQLRKVLVKRSMMMKKILKQMTWQTQKL